MSVLYIHLLIETMLQNFPSMNYRQPTSTSTVQILAEPANKFSKSQVARSSPIVKKQYIQLSNQGITLVQKNCTLGRTKKHNWIFNNFTAAFCFVFFWGGGMLLGVILYKAEERPPK